MDFEKAAQQIIKNVGGRKNIAELTHCYTRLRFSLNDNKLANSEAIEKIDGVMQVVEKGGQYQVVIGPDVASVYKVIVDNKMIDQQDSSEDEGPKKNDEEKHGIKYYFDQALDVLISCFTPIIPVIAGSGMVKVLNAILVSTHVLTSNSPTYVVLNAIGDGIYYFLPFFVAITASKRLEADTFISMTIAAIMMYPKLMAIAAKGNGITSFMNIPMQLMDYSGQALPIIFIVILVKYVDKFADKVTPNLVKTFLRPMITLLISAPISLWVFGPAASYLSGMFNSFVQLMNQFGWLAVGLNAVLFPFLVLTGTHNALIPLMIQMFATQGFDAVLIPSGLAANIAESGAAAAVSAKTKDTSMKSTALGASISALFGITEPALYGVNLKLKRPFIGMLGGSLVGGIVGGLIHLKAIAFVSPSILSLPIFIGRGSNLITAIITVLVSFAASFVFVYLLGFKDQIKNSDSKKIIKQPITKDFKLKMRQPVKGAMIKLSDVKDDVFSAGTLGKGFAVNPFDNIITSPVDGTVETVFPTKHAIGLKTSDGLEVLVHMGIDTVNLKGKYFETFVKNNQRIKVGDKIATMDINKIKDSGYDPTVIVVVTNTNQYKSVDEKVENNSSEVMFNVE